MSKVVCKICYWKGRTKKLLVAKSPFEEDEDITACPKCKAINSTRAACDESGCWCEVTIGIPTKDGYRCTCWFHRPKEARG